MIFHIFHNINYVINIVKCHGICCTINDFQSGFKLGAVGNGLGFGLALLWFEIG